MQINGIAHIQLSVRDYEACSRFYESVCVFFEMKEVPYEQGRYWIGGRTGIAITKTENTRPFDESHSGLHHSPKKWCVNSHYARTAQSMLCKPCMKSNEAVLTAIESKIYLIRNEKVMLDHDLADLYGVPTMRLNEQVKRHAKRFPRDFMFRLSDHEFRALISQIAISKKGRGGRRRPPLAFTEQGVAMLSAVLNSERAIDVNVAIMRAFVRLRQVLTSNKEFENKIAELESKYDGQFEAVFEAIRELMSTHAVPLKRIVGLGNAGK